MTTSKELHWAQQVRKAIEVGNRKLCVFSFNGHDCLLESYEVSELLGYKQLSSLRKQTLTDWKGYMVEGTDFVMVHDEELLELYDELFFRVRAVQLVKTKPSRGRLFFTPDGMAKVIKKTSKPSAELERALRNDYNFDNVKWDQDVPKVVASKDPIPLHQPTTTKSKEERMFEYEVMQTLLKQLERLKEPPLRELAIAAAEVALGRSLPELRGTKPTVLDQATGSFHEKGGPKPTKPSTTRIPKPVPAGARFTQEDYYSMTRIGEKAGGYSAKQAGQAADIVASKLGYTRKQIRNDQLPFNEIALRPDTSTGKKRPMVRFNRDFSNRVVDELRSNPSFQPSFTPGAPTLPSFSGDVTYPVLSKGIFEDEDDSTPPASRQA